MVYPVEVTSLYNGPIKRPIRGFGKHPCRMNTGVEEYGGDALMVTSKTRKGLIRKCNGSV